MTGTSAARTSGPHHSQRYPKRLTLDLSQDDHDALMGARYADRVPMADRIRALVSLWREDPVLAEAVSIRAQELLPPPGSTAPPTEQPHAEDGPPAS
jgi:hypothetical protein